MVGTEKKKSPYRKAITYIIIILIIGVWIYVKNLPEKDITFVIISGQSWYSCWNEVTTLTINYDLSSSSPVDLMFTPTEGDVTNLNETSQNYPSCYNPNVLKYKSSCNIAGKGCIAIINKNTNDATVNLKYSAIIQN
jgi:hypothetical protein